MTTINPIENINLVVSAANQEVIVNEVIFLIAKTQCHIEESRFIALGAEFMGIIRVSGNWNAIAKLEDTLTNLETSQQVTITFKRDAPFHLKGNFLPYLVQVIGLNTPTLLNEVAHFFIEQKIQIVDIQTNPFKSNYSDTKMITLEMHIYIPTELNIVEIRDQFMVLCEETNVDGILEPEKSIK